jgi:hypothetical protein
MASNDNDLSVNYEAPKPPPEDADYEVYAAKYRLYLQLLDEFHSRVRVDNQVEASVVRTPTVTFAPQRQMAIIRRSPPPPYAHTFMEEEDSETERTVRQNLRRLGVGARGRRAVSPSASVNSAGSRSVNTDRLSRLARGEHTGHVKPDEQQIRQGLGDVCDQHMITWLLDNNRAPKTYRSLFNLREMAIRRTEQSGKRLMSKASWHALRDAHGGLPPSPPGTAGT